MDKKVAIITGAATGIGKGIALRLAKEGISITLNFRSSETDALETKKEIERLGVECLLYQCTVTDDVKVREMVKETVSHFGRVDILVNNAGTTDYIDHKDLDGLSSEHWDKVMDTNVKGLFYCSRAAAEELKKTNGCIINITSVAGQTGLGSSIAYAASKAAANSITKSLARTLGPEVRVNSIAPGIIQTRWTNGQGEFVQELSEGTPLKRLGNPEDVAELAYALSSHSSFVTGEIIRVDGGMFIT